MSPVDPGPTPAQDLTDALQMLYQCPVGLLELDDAGLVRTINPAAVRMLLPGAPDRDLHSFFPLLRRLDPTLVDLARSSPGTTGPLPTGRRVIVPGGTAGEQLELSFVRLTPDRVMVTVVDVSEERRLAAREREISLRLQQSMLGRLDQQPGLSVAVSYRVAEHDREVGGDWYDVLALPDDRTGLVIGDVSGHNLTATVAMGQLRSALRSLAHTYLEPADLLEHTDRFAFSVPDAECTTVTYAVLDRPSGLLRYSSAGHPPPLLVHRDGSAEFLWGGRGRPIVCLEPVHRVSAEQWLEDGDLLVLYTDGLVERRTASIDEGMERLRAAAARHRGLEPQALCDQLVASLLADGPAEDDVCLLVLRHHPVPPSPADRTGDQASDQASDRAGDRASDRAGLIPAQGRPGVRPPLRAGRR